LSIIFIATYKKDTLNVNQYTTRDKNNTNKLNQKCASITTKIPTFGVIKLQGSRIVQEHIGKLNNYTAD